MRRACHAVDLLLKLLGLLCEEGGEEVDDRVRALGLHLAVNQTGSLSSELLVGVLMTTRLCAGRANILSTNTRRRVGGGKDVVRHVALPAGRGVRCTLLVRNAVVVVVVRRVLFDVASGAHTQRRGVHAVLAFLRLETVDEVPAVA